MKKENYTTVSLSPLNEVAEPYHSKKCAEHDGLSQVWEKNLNLTSVPSL